MNRGLTGKQQRFVDAYIICLNATEACRRAGYEGTENTMAVQGSMNIRNPKILALISERLNDFAMSASEVLTHLTDIARGDLADVLTERGEIDPLEAKQRGKSHLIKRFKYKHKTITTTDDNGEGSEILEDEHEIEMYDRLKALELLAKYHDLVNRVRIEDWRTDAIADIRAGNIDYVSLVEAFDESLASQLFTAAGVPISTE